MGYRYRVGLDCGLWFLVEFELWLEIKFGKGVDLD